MKQHLTGREKFELMQKATTHSGMFRAMGLRPMGFWTQTAEVSPAARADGLLWPAELVDLTWAPEERARVVAYLKAGKKMMAYCGTSTCRLCLNDNNGSQDFFDEVYVWPEGFAHYVEEHGVKPPQAFIDHVLRRK